MDGHRNINWADDYRDYIILCFVTEFNLILATTWKYFKLLYAFEFVVFEDPIYLRLYFLKRVPLLFRGLRGIASCNELHKNIVLAKIL